MKKPHIALLFVGGTIGMVPDPKTGALKPAHNAEALLQLVPGLEKKVDIDVVHLFNVDSSNMTQHHWSTIAENIYSRYNDYDGFVVAQGTDTMVYSAAATSFALQNLGKPVVFTGSIVPMSELGADGRNNLIYSCLVAGMDIGEVCIVFGNKIVRGNRAKKNHESFVDVFQSPNYPLLGEVERPIRLYDWRNKCSDAPVEYKPGFDERIGLVTLFPGIDPSVVRLLMENGAKGLVLQGYGPGNLPFLEHSFVDVIQEATNNKIPLVITSQMQKSVTNLHAYEAGYKALEAGALSAHDMTPEATIVKLMWALKQSDNYSTVRTLMETDLAGEISEQL